MITSGNIPKKELSEFRQDLVSGEWVLFATGRSRRPYVFSDQENDGEQKECPFDIDSLEASGNEIVSRYPESDPEIVIIKNKFPAVKMGKCGLDLQVGPFKIHDAVGTHEVIIYKDHRINWQDFSVAQAVKAIEIFKRRFKEIASIGDCSQYIMIFHNAGKVAGASIAHPHSQIITMPILPPDVHISIHGSQKFYEKNRRRVYDVIIGWEIAEGARIVYENESFVAFCPFTSKYGYEVRIFSKESHAHFEQMPEELNHDLADVMTVILRKIKIALNNPPFNFFIHTAPLEGTIVGDPHEFYHWHIEIIPHTKTDAGFEIGTGVNINTIDPDDAARLLRETQI